MEKYAMFNIDRESSIENEPKTLNINQLHQAREAALYVMKTRSMEDAMKIFTEGLVPVVSCARACRDNLTMEPDDEFNFSEKLLRISGQRDIATAPF